MTGASARRALRALPGWQPLMRRRGWLARGIEDTRARTRFASCHQPDDLAVTVADHASPLSRSAPTEPTAPEDPLQAGKVRNLAAAATRLDGVLLRPGETFSFWHLVGAPAARRGFAPGVVLLDDQLDADTGGGLCAASNLLHWLALHADLDVVEHAEHTVDPFPDRNRTVPWGAGCTVSWPRLDLRIVNRSELTYQWRLAIRDGELAGALLADRMPEHAYQVFERDPGFDLVDGVPHRHNELWRAILDPRTGERLGEHRLARNHAPTAYRPPLVGPLPALVPPVRLPRERTAG